jgi:hypothetical protein
MRMIITNPKMRTRSEVINEIPFKKPRSPAMRKDQSPPSAGSSPKASPAVLMQQRLIVSSREIRSQDKSAPDGSTHATAVAVRVTGITDIEGEGPMRLHYILFGPFETEAPAIWRSSGAENTYG